MQERPLARAWLLATRPKTLPAAIVPVAVGACCAWLAGGVKFLPTLAALLGAMLLQIGSNFANDVYDFEKGADTLARLGPARMVAAGLISSGAMKRGMLLVFGLASLLGVYLTQVAGPLILLVGLLSIVSAIAYTGGPYPLGYNGLGELFVLIFFGFVAVVTTCFINAGTASALAWLSAVPVGCLAAAILVVNNVRDIETDRDAGKRTLAARFGRKFGVAQYGVLLVASYLAPLGMYGLRRAEFSILLPVLSAPLAYTLFRKLATQTGPALNAVLADTAKLLVVYGAMLCLGLSFSSVLRLPE
jgi:1,4-dihydroxy-2-naphthoate octaprenyltransferase